MGNRMDKDYIYTSLAESLFMSFYKSEYLSYLLELLKLNIIKQFKISPHQLADIMKKSNYIKL